MEERSIIIVKCSFIKRSLKRRVQTLLCLYIITFIMKKIIISMLIISIITIITVFFWLRPQNNTTVQLVIPDATSTSITTEAVSEEEVIDLIVEKPASFNGVEMVTYQSEYGFEITYPKEWQKNEFSRVPESPNEREDFSYSFTPDFYVPESERHLYGDFDTEQKRLNPAFWISVGDYYYKDTFSLHPEEGEEWYLINGHKSIYFTFGGVHSYSFFENEKYYQIRINSRAISLSRSTDEEALWILSTFKITK